MIMLKNEFNQRLFEFLAASPTPFHAVSEMRGRLQEAGFVELEEQNAWSVKAGGRYFLVRNDSAIVAWQMPADGGLPERGFRMVGAHTDSPCLRVKPNPVLLRQGCVNLGVEVYGGVLLNPWFDRDLSLAGRVSYLAKNGEVCSALINFVKPIAIIPSLAIHLDRTANSERSVNPQTDIPPLLAQVQVDGDEFDFRAMLKAELAREDIDDVDKILDYELSFYDVQGGGYVGLNEEFIASARLDNLLSCFIGLEALIESDSEEGALLICNDHEEVGSLSACGAQGPMLMNLLERLLPDNELRNRALANSMMVSADNAHAVHPNFADKHDANHGPKLNAGPVIKINNNQRYATNSETAAIFRNLADLEDVPVQSFVVRTDMGCGSTIGPITSGELGVKTIDVGAPQYAMHSIREICGSDDAVNLARILQRFYRLEKI